MFKDQVFEILESNINTFVSTKSLVEGLKRDRNQIWKAIERLRDEGYRIVSQPKKGYRLIEQGINETKLIELLKEEFQLVYFDTMNSSNDYAKENSFNSKKVVIVANEQVNARGQRNKAFTTVKNKGLYFTMLYQEELEIDKIKEVPLLTSMAIQKVIQQHLGHKCEIKWINDLYYQNRKVAGILCESSIEPKVNKINKWMIGVGINLGDIEFSNELKDIATSLHCDYDATILLYLLIKEIDDMCKESFAEHRENYERKSLLIGNRVKIDKGTHEYEGYASGISKEGQLIIELNSNEIEYLNEGSVRLL